MLPVLFVELCTPKGIKKHSGKTMLEESRGLYRMSNSVPKKQRQMKALIYTYPSGKREVRYRRHEGHKDIKEWADLIKQFPSSGYSIEEA